MQQCCDCEMIQHCCDALVRCIEDTENVTEPKQENLKVVSTSCYDESGGTNEDTNLCYEYEIARLG